MESSQIHVLCTSRQTQSLHQQGSPQIYHFGKIKTYFLLTLIMMPVSRISSIQWLWDPGLLHLWCHWESNHLPTDWAWTLRTQSPLAVKLCWLWYFTVIISISLFFHSYSRKANGLIVHYRNFPKAIQQFNGKYQQIQVKYQHDLSFFFIPLPQNPYLAVFTNPGLLNCDCEVVSFMGVSNEPGFFLSTGVLVMNEQSVFSTEPS